MHKMAPYSLKLFGGIMLAEISIYPLDKGISLSKYVAEALDMIDKSGLQYRMGPMGTVIEGRLEDVYALIIRIHKRMRLKSRRVAAYIKIDDRAGRKDALSYKPASIEKRLGRKLRK